MFSSPASLRPRIHSVVKLAAWKSRDLVQEFIRPARNLRVRQVSVPCVEFVRGRISPAVFRLRSLYCIDPGNPLLQCRYRRRSVGSVLDEDPGAARMRLAEASIAAMVSVKSMRPSISA
jgi:hypothetical protein